MESECEIRNLKSEMIYGTRGRNRTCGQQLRRLMLYPLSYAGVSCEKADPNETRPNGRSAMRAEMIIICNPRRGEKIEAFPRLSQLAKNRGRPVRMILGCARKKFKAFPKRNLAFCHFICWQWQGRE